MAPTLRRSVFLLFIFSLPLAAWSQSTLNFPRAVSPADLGSTGFAVVNPGAASAVVAYTFYDSSGQALASSSLTIPPQGQVAKLGGEMFPLVSTAGWVQATSPTTGLQGFWLGGDFVTYGDGAEAAAAASSLIFPLVAAQTEIDAANPGTSAITITFRLFRANGLEAAPSAVQTLPGHGVFQSRVSSLFSGADLAQATHIQANCTGPCTGTSVVTDYLVSPSWGVINAVDAASTLTTANFPHVVSGGGAGGNYTSVIGLTNLTPTAQTVTITFNPAPQLGLRGSIVIPPPQSVTQTLAGNGAIRDTLQNLFALPAGFNDGWVRITSAGAMTGFIAYSESVQGGLAVVPVQRTPTTTMLFAHIADLPPWYTGLALLNTGATSATVEVFAMTPAGALIGGAANVGTARFTLNAGTKRAALLSELIPQTQQRTSDGGFVFVRSSAPLYGMELFFNRSLTILSNIAAGDIAPGITFTPPSPTPPPPPPGGGPSK